MATLLSLGLGLACLLPLSCESSGAPASDNPGSGGPLPSSGDSPIGDDGDGGANDPSVEDPTITVNFEQAAGFHRILKSDPIPDLAIELTTDPLANDQAVGALTIQGNPELGPTDFVGPGLHAAELEINSATHLYGKYVFRARFPSCAPEEELVSGLFTYFNDGTDTNQDSIADNSELDIEHLCGGPKYLWLSVWTDYQSSPLESFRKTTRRIDMRAGKAMQTDLGSSTYDLKPEVESVPVVIPDFPNPDQYYEIGFEWRKDWVRYFLVEKGVEKNLWLLEGAEYIPQRPATVLINLWHPSPHWSKTGDADFPASDATRRYASIG